jgi:membrane-associated HD superfamily phosphohydrolase
MIPGKLTQAYFSGRQKSYLSPIRIFLVFAAIHFAALSSLFSVLFAKSLDGFASKRHEVGYFNLYTKQLDTVCQKLKLEFLPARPIVKSVLDSVEKKMKQRALQNDYEENIGYVELKADKFKLNTIKLGEQDYINPDPEALVATRKVVGFWNQLQVKQAFKLLNNINNFTQFLLAKFTWMVLFMLLALAVVLKVLYLRRKKYFVEHLVFTLHYHTFAFLVMSIVFLFVPVKANYILINGMALLLILIYLFWAMKRYYQQSFFKTLFKFLVLNFSYLFIFSLAITMTIFVSLFLF